MTYETYYLVSFDDTKPNLCFKSVHAVIGSVLKSVSAGVAREGGDVIAEQFSLNINFLLRQTYSGTGIESKIV